MIMNYKETIILWQKYGKRKQLDNFLMKVKEKEN